MDFGLIVEQEELSAMERTWLRRHDPIAARRMVIDDEPASVSPESRAHITESGLVALLTAESGGSNVDLLVLVEAHGWAGSAVPLAEWAVAAQILDVMEGECGDPVTPVLGVRAQIVDGRLRIAGTSKPSPGFADVDRVLIVAATADGRETAALVSRADVTVRPVETLDVLRSWAVVDVDRTIDAGAWSILPEGTVARTADQLATFRAVDALGCCDRLLESTSRHVGERRQFGKPIGSFQAVKHHVADMVLAVEASRSTLWAAAAALDDDSAPGRARAVSSAVAFACRSASTVAQTALQVHGGIGFTWEHDLHLLLRRVKVDELMDGSPRDHSRRIVR